MILGAVQGAHIPWFRCMERLTILGAGPGASSSHPIPYRGTLSHLSVSSTCCRLNSSEGTILSMCCGSQMLACNSSFTVFLTTPCRPLMPDIRILWGKTAKWCQGAFSPTVDQLSEQEAARGRALEVRTGLPEETGTGLQQQSSSTSSGPMS